MRPDSNGIGRAREGLARIIRTEANAVAANRAAAQLALLTPGTTAAVVVADPYGLSLDEHCLHHSPVRHRPSQRSGTPRACLGGR